MRAIRDVQPATTLGQDLASFLRYFVHPVQTVSLLPRWTLTRILIFHFSSLFLLGAVAGIFPWPNSPLHFWLSVILLPTLGTLSWLILALILKLAIPLAVDQRPGFHAVLILALLTQLPLYVTRLFIPVSGLIMTVGFAMSAMILTVGLTENFKVPKKKSMMIVACLYSLAFILWFGSYMQTRELQPF